MIYLVVGIQIQKSQYLYDDVYMKFLALYSIFRWVGSLPYNQCTVPVYGMMAYRGVGV